MEKEFLKLGLSGEEKSHTRWCSTMNGREFGRINSWGAGPKRGVRITFSFSLRSEYRFVPISQVNKSNVGRLPAWQSDDAS